MLNIAVIGYGGRINSVVTDLVKTGKVKLAAVMDIDNDAVKKNYIDKNGFEGVRYYTDADEMITTERPDGVLIGTRCSTHTHYALLVAKYSIPMFLEKPVCTTYEDLERLRTIPHMNDKTVVSFPLRMSQLVEYVKGIVDSGKLGRIEHVQAYNNVPYARGYYHKWYRDESETGGLFLQKATHDLDYINYILGFRPVRVCAMTSKQIFKGDKPAGLKCADCPDADSCPESPANVLKVDSSRQPGEYCCFAVDTGNEDSGSVIIEYDTGMHVVYSQDFIVRNSAGKRGARLIGYKGTLEFDWYSDVVTVYNHMQNSVEHHTLAKTLEGHFGGDAVLERNFIAVMEGRERSVAPLSDGILSAELCLAARRSAKEHVFVDISNG
jgi:predicted dehydrogenase